MLEEDHCDIHEIVYQPIPTTAREKEGYNEDKFQDQWEFFFLIHRQQEIFSIKRSRAIAATYGEPPYTSSSKRGG